MFLALKARMRRHYKEGAIPFSKLHTFVASIIKDMSRMDMRGYFEACGYGVANQFNTSRGWSDDIIDVTCRGGEAFAQEDLVAEGEESPNKEGDDGPDNEGEREGGDE